MLQYLLLRRHHLHPCKRREEAQSAISILPRVNLMIAGAANRRDGQLTPTDLPSHQSIELARDQDTTRYALPAVPAITDNPLLPPKFCTEGGSALQRR